eukprot:Seg4137.2 transcript_id=Seg4137.2/GoldUCD/mRNA.D3Y31 product="Glutamate receptor 3.1" protein_id=Seg4137.2/GoldUCD/D3Y31
MEMMLSFVLWLFLLLDCTLVCAREKPLTFKIGFISPWNTTDSALRSLGKEMLSIYKLAIEDANNDAVAKKSLVRISANFTGLVMKEDDCKRDKQYLNSNVIGLIGAYTSSCTTDIQRHIMTSGSKLSQISYGSTAAKLGNKNKFPTLLRTSSSDESQAQALADLVKHFRWRKVGLIGMNDLQGEALINEFRSRLHDHGIMLSETITFKHGDGDDVIDSRLQKLKDADTKVNILMAVGDDALKVFQRAKLKKMTGEGWVWIGNDGVAATLLQADKDVKKSTEGLIAVSPKMPTGENLLTLIMSWFGKSTKEFPGVIWRLKIPGISPYDAQVYDAVFAYYHALESLARNKNITKDTTVEDTRSLVFEELKRFKDWSSGFSSISGGKMYFDVDGNTLDAPASYDIVNFVDGTLINVGSWNETSLGLNLPSGKIVWPGGTKKTPTDRGTPGKPLFKIGFIAPLHSGLGALRKHGQELVSAAKVTVDIINSDRNQHVEIDLKIMDEGLDGEDSCKNAAENLLAYNVVAVVGAYRSSCSIAVSKALASTNTPIISYASAASILSNKAQHPYFFRVIPSDFHESNALIKLVTKYGFKGVGTLASQEITSVETAQTFEGHLKNSSLSVAISERFPSNADAKVLRPLMKKMKQTPSHVNLLSTLISDTLPVIQQAKQSQIVGKGWVWIGTSGVTSELFSANSELAKSLEGLLGIGPSTGEGSVYLNFLSKWLEKDSTKYPGIIHKLVNPAAMAYTSQVFDAINGIALSLSDLITRKVISHPMRQKVMRIKLYQKLKTYKDLATGYPSASGTKSMYFDENQDGPPVLDILNLLDSKWKTIGGYSGHANRISFTQDPIFPGGTTVPIIGAGKVMYNVAAFFPKDPKLGPLAELGHAWESALVAAVDWMNKNQSITVGFKLKTFDGGNDEQSCAKIAQGLPKNIDLVIGEFRSFCTEAIYQQAERRNIPVISYGATSSTLSNKMMYPYLFRTCPSNKYQINALNELVEKLKWEKLGIISEKGVYGTGLMKGITEKLMEKDVRITTSEDFLPGKAERITKNILSLKSSGTGVNLIISQPSDAERVFQEAFEQGMTGKGWTWLGSDGAVSSKFTKSQHLQHAMQGMVGFRPLGAEGHLFSSITKKWKFGGKKDEIPYLAQVLDSLLAPAMALHRLHSRKIVTEKTKRSDVRNLMVRKLQEMKDGSSGFESTTGKLFYFDGNQDSPGNYDLVNLNRVESSEGVWRERENNFDWRFSEGEHSSRDETLSIICQLRCFIAQLRIPRKLCLFHNESNDLD